MSDADLLRWRLAAAAEIQELHAQLAAALKERDEAIVGRANADKVLAQRDADLEQALKDRDAAQAALKAAESLLEMAGGTQSRLTQERDEARAQWQDCVTHLDRGVAVFDGMQADLDRLRAALEPTAESIEALDADQYLRALVRNYHPVTSRVLWRTVLAAIRARAGLPEGKP